MKLHARRKRTLKRRRLKIEDLENRRVLAVGAGVISVTTLSDVVDPNDGVVSLREAIEEANADIAASEIVFAPDLTANGPATITLSGTQLPISSNLTIVGAGDDLLTIDAAGLSRIFIVDDLDNNSHIDVFLSGLTLTGGVAGGGFSGVGFGAGDGGAIISRENLTIEDSSIVNNFASRAAGGILQIEGTLNITDSLVSQNTAIADGGGIFNGQLSGNTFSTVNLLRTTVSLNSAGGDGGGIANEVANRVVNVIDSSIIDNTAGDDGGGIYTGFSADLQVNNSTISGNTASSEGGGIGNAYGGTITIEDSVISSNTGGQGGGVGGGFSGTSLFTIERSSVTNNIATGDGGGVFNTANGIVNITDTLVSDNSSGVPGSSSNGGGIFTFGELQLERSTVSGNTATGEGGGIFATAGFYGTPLGILNSTIHGNSANDDAGGLFASLTVRPLIEFSTITANTTGGNGGGIAAETGAINNPFTVLSHTIVVGNSGQDLANARGTSSAFISGGFNLIGTGGFELAPFTQNDTVNVSEQAALLGPLQDNGGLTPTRALLPGSPAFNAGDPTAVAGQDDVPEFDQRGDGFDRVSNLIVDIGAFEVPPPPTVNFDLTSQNTVEANSVINVAVSLTSPSTTTEIVPFTVTGSAGSDDFDISSGSITFPTNSTNGVISINVFDDTIDELPETVIITLNPTANVALGTFPSFVLTINDDDPTPTVNVSPTDQSVFENNTTIQFDVDLSAPSGLAVTIPLLVSGTADGQDFDLPVTSVTIPAGATSVPVNINLFQDDQDESDESIVVTLGTPTNADLGAETVHTVAIQNVNVPLVGFTTAAQTVGEEVGTTQITVELDGPTIFDVVVPLNISGTADGSDFAINANSVTIPAGNLSATINVSVQNDLASEFDEDLIVTLGTPTSANLGAQTIHTLTIIDDDNPMVMFSSTEQTVTESGLAFSATVILNVPVNEDVFIPFGITGTANFGDFNIDVGSVTIPAGQLSATIFATVRDDDLNEPDETVILTLGQPTGAGLDTELVHTVTLLDNDLAPVDFADAPQGYAVLLADDGPRHEESGLFLGETISFEFDALSSNAADGDNDDGVTQVSTAVVLPTSQTSSSFVVSSSGAGFLDVFIDFNQDFDFDDPGEQIASSLAVNQGDNTVDFAIDSGTTLGTTIARFRLSSTGGLAATGLASDGEVEDVLLQFVDGTTSQSTDIGIVNGVTNITNQNALLTVGDAQSLFFAAPTAELVGLTNVVGGPLNDQFVLQLTDGNLADGLAIDAGAGLNQIDVIAPVDTDISDAGSVSLQNFLAINLNNPATQQLTIDLDSLVSILPENATTLSVTGGPEDSLQFPTPTNFRFDQSLFVDNTFVRRILNDTNNLVIDSTLGPAYHNFIQPFDTNISGEVTALDALVIINELDRRDFSNSDGVLISPTSSGILPDDLFDTNGDNSATALDALLVINELSRRAAEESAEGESGLLLSGFLETLNPTTSSTIADQPSGTPLVNVVNLTQVFSNADASFALAADEVIAEEYSPESSESELEFSLAEDQIATLAAST